MEQVYGPLNKNKMTYNNDWKPTENNMPDTFHPTPQTPEQVDEGLRAAFREAKKNGVIDATPYLKQMTFTNDIEKIESEIKVLEKKLELLKEIETHKSPVAKAYKDWWGQYPELETDSEYDEMMWQGFQAGFQAAYEEQVREDDYYNAKSQPKAIPPDEPLEYDEVEHDISENVENKTIRQVIDRWWMDTFTSKNMWSVNECIDDLADQIQFWILRNKK